MTKAILTLCAIAALAGCASPDGPRRPGPRSAEDPDRTDAAPRPSLFISPSGKPFRAPAGQPYPAAAWFAEADRNGDGRIDRQEFRDDAEAFFRVVDRNHDGVIDGFEVAQYERRIAPEILGAYRVGPETDEGSRDETGPRAGGGAGRRGRDGRGGGPLFGGAEAGVLQGAAPFSLLNEPEPIMAADTDLNGRITLAQFLATADRRFDRLDTLHAGYLTLADLPSAPSDPNRKKSKSRK